MWRKKTKREKGRKEGGKEEEVKKTDEKIRKTSQQELQASVGGEVRKQIQAKKNKMRVKARRGGAWRGEGRGV